MIAVGHAVGAASTAPARVATETTLDAIADERWDEIVESMPRPTPFLLQGWLMPWWRHFGWGRELAVHTARVDGRLVGALPLAVGTTWPRTAVAQFVGAPDSTLADIVAPADADPTLLRRLLDQARAGHRLLDLHSLAPDGHLASILPQPSVHTRARAPVMQLAGGWDETFGRKTSSRRRALYRRRWRQLRGLGRVELAVAAGEGDMGLALEDAFRVHTLRWRSRPDVSTFADDRGRAFNRDAVAALARSGRVRLLMLRIDGAPVAFTCSLLAGGRMFLYRLAFDPAYGRWSPGILVTLEAIRLAADEGASCVEFLRGTERYKVELADRVDPLSQAVIATGGRALAAKAAINGRVRAGRTLRAGRRAGRGVVRAVRRREER